MTGTTVVEQVKSALTMNSVSKEYFRHNLEWLTERETNWKHNHVRLGLIGITSSGKSTLLNAIVGDDILPSAVRPSTSMLITCNYADELSAIVEFSNKPREQFAGNQVIQQVRKYGDEQTNPRNKYEVKSIRLGAPGYLLDEAFRLVDSPGLDAHGFEYHETLTLETLLPTLDMCIFVTTMKATSDESTARFLELIVNHDIPVVLVQNMLDSVERKIGRDGVVLKPREKVCEEHRDRLARIVSQIKGYDETKVRIVQVSAKQALRARRQKNEIEFQVSGFPNLLSGIQAHLTEYWPKIERQRLIQLHTHLSHIVTEEDGQGWNTSDTNEVADDNIGSFQDSSALQSRFSGVLSEIEYNNSKIDRIIQQAGKYLENPNYALFEKIGFPAGLFSSQTKVMDGSDIERTSKFVNELSKVVAKKVKAIRNATKDFHQEITEAVSLLNLNPRDFMIEHEQLSGSEGYRFHMITETERRTKWQDKEGIGHGIARAFGGLFGQKSWGREEVEYDVTVLNIEAMKKELKDFQRKHNRLLTSYLAQWQNTVERLQSEIDAEVKRRNSERDQKRRYRELRAHVRESVETIRAIVREIETELGINSNRRSISPGTRVNRKKNQDVEVIHEVEAHQATHKTVLAVSKDVFNIYRLAHEVKQRIFQRIWQHALVEAGGHESVRKLLVWGWDGGQVQQFCRRFMQIDVKLNPDETGLQILNANGTELWVVTETRLNEEQRRRVLNDGLSTGRCVLYVMVDAVQQGHMMNLIERSQLFKGPHLHRANLVVHWVLQSIQEFRQDGNIEEGVHSFLELCEHIPIETTGSSLVNDENPVYSLALMELSKNRYVSQADEKLLLDRLKKHTPYLVPSRETLAHVSKFIRGFTQKRERMSI